MNFGFGSFISGLLQGRALLSQSKSGQKLDRIGLMERLEQCEAAIKSWQDDAQHYKRTAITADNEVHAIIEAVSSMLDQMEDHAGRGRLTKTAIQLYRGEVSKLLGRKI